MCNGNCFPFITTSLTLLLIPTSHQNRVIYGSSELYRADYDACHKRKTDTHLIRNCHVHEDCKLNHCHQKYRKNDGLEHDHNDNKYR